LEEIAREADEVFEPERLEPQLRAKLLQLVRHGLIEEVVTSDDSDRSFPLMIVRAQAPKESKTIDERHAQIEDDCVRVALLGFAQSGFCADGRAHLISLESQHSREGLRHALIVVDDQDFAGRGWRHRRWHGLL
jgi:hypothetical protein